MYKCRLIIKILNKLIIVLSVIKREKEEDRVGGNEEVGWRVGEKKVGGEEQRGWGQEERMIVTSNTNWHNLYPSLRHNMLFTCVFAEVSAVAAVLIEKKNIVKLFNNFMHMGQVNYIFTLTIPI